MLFRSSKRLKQHRKCTVCVQCIYNMHTFAILYIQTALGLRERARSFVCTNNCMIEYLKKSNDSDVPTHRHATLPPVECVCCTNQKGKKPSKQETDCQICDATKMWKFEYSLAKQHIEKHKHKNAINILGIHLVVIAFVCNRLNCVFFRSFLVARMRLFVVQSFCLHLRLHHTMYGVRFVFALNMPM